MAAAAIMADQNLESRVARIESDVAHIREDIAEMKLDMREFRKELAKLDQKLVNGLASNQIWMLLQGAAILAVLARAFKWL